MPRVGLRVWIAVNEEVKIDTVTSLRDEPSCDRARRMPALRPGCKEAPTAPHFRWTTSSRIRFKSSGRLHHDRRIRADAGILGVISANGGAGGPYPCGHRASVSTLT